MGILDLYLRVKRINLRHFNRGGDNLPGNLRAAFEGEAVRKVRRYLLTIWLGSDAN